MKGILQLHFQFKKVRDDWLWGICCLDILISPTDLLSEVRLLRYLQHRYAS